MDEGRSTPPEQQAVNPAVRVRRAARDRNAARYPAPKRRRPADRPGSSSVRPPSRRPAPPPPRDERSVEDLLGGRVLAWAGGAAVLVGLGLLFAMAVSSGWLDETARAAIGAGIALALAGAGLHLHRRAGRTHASLALVGTGVAGLFMATSVATAGYELVPPLAGMAAATAVGGWATWLARRWRAQVIACLGLLGAVASPLLAGAPADGLTAAFLVVATACAVTVTALVGWERLAVAVLTVAALQWVPFALVADPVTITALVAAFGALGLTAALAPELRAQVAAPSVLRALVLGANAVLIAIVAYLGCADAGTPGTGAALLAAIAAVHAAVGLAGLRGGRLSEETSLLTILIGLIVANIAFGIVADGPVRALGWMAAAGGFALLARRPGADRERTLLLGAGLGGHVALAMAQTLVLAPPSAIEAGTVDAAGLIGLAALASTCLTGGIVLRGAHPTWADAANVLGLAFVAVTTIAVLDGAALATALAFEAVALAQIGRRHADRVAVHAADAYLGVAALLAFLVLAPPATLAGGLMDALPALGALAAVAGAAILLAHHAPAGGDERRVRIVAAAIASLYLVSCAAVNLTPTGGGADQGQLQLTAVWALCGVAGLVVGLRRDIRAVRAAAFALIGVAVGKAFLFDMATLAPVQRIGSLLALGVLLLGGAFVYQRLRPEPLADLRDVPEALR